MRVLSFLAGLWLLAFIVCGALGMFGLIDDGPLMWMLDATIIALLVPVVVLLVVFAFGLIAGGITGRW